LTRSVYRHKNIHMVVEAASSTPVPGDNRGAGTSPAGARTNEDVRAVPLARGRALAAATFDAVLRAHTDRRDYGASNCAVACALEVAEKQVRQYRRGEKVLPFGAIYVLPRSVALELLTAARAALRPTTDRRRTMGSHVRRLSSRVGELNALLERPHASPEERSRALRLAASNLISEAEALVCDLNEES
jgi:hypothetical protein